MSTFKFIIWKSKRGICKGRNLFKYICEMACFVAVTKKCAIMRPFYSQVETSLESTMALRFDSGRIFATSILRRSYLLHIQVLYKWTFGSGLQKRKTLSIIWYHRRSETRASCTNHFLPIRFAAKLWETCIAIRHRLLWYRYDVSLLISDQYNNERMHMNPSYWNYSLWITFVPTSENLWFVSATFVTVCETSTWKWISR